MKDLNLDKFSCKSRRINMNDNGNQHGDYLFLIQYIIDNIAIFNCYSLNECYFANKGAAVVLGAAEHGCVDRLQSPVRSNPQSDIQNHLQSMFYLLRPEETLKMVSSCPPVKHSFNVIFLILPFSYNT